MTWWFHLLVRRIESLVARQHVFERVARAVGRLPYGELCKQQLEEECQGDFFITWLYDENDTHVVEKGGVTFCEDGSVYWSGVVGQRRLDMQLPEFVEWRSVGRKWRHVWGGTGFPPKQLMLDEPRHDLTLTDALLVVPSAGARA